VHQGGNTRTDTKKTIKKEEVIPPLCISYLLAMLPGHCSPQGRFAFLAAGRATLLRGFAGRTHRDVIDSPLRLHKSAAKYNQ
jgi:hypothetical protein